MSIKTNKIIKKTRQIIKEIFGRISVRKPFGASFYGRDIPEIDAEKNDYDLTKSIFYASPFNKTGEKFIFGSSFGKPIVNSITAFALSEPLFITCEDKETKEMVDDWLEEQHGQIYKGMRNAIRDGDCYLSLDGEDVMLTAPSQVAKITDPLHNGKIVGYDIEVETENKKVYLTKIRKTKPYKEVIEFEDGNAKEGKVIQRDDVIKLEGIEKIQKEEDENQEVIIAGKEEEKLLSMVAFVNEKEPEMKYGISEYQNCYYLMSAYHDVLENAIKNNIYNGTATPYVSAEDIDEFLALNFDKDKDGNYQLKWVADNMIVGGKDMKAGFMEAPKTQGEAKILLKILFYLICQASETPEFLMGTAVQSSKASVSEQMPIVIKKALRKQEEFKRHIKELVGLYLEEKGKGDVDFNLVMPEVVSDKDLKLNKEIVDTLLEHGCITRKTADIMLEIDNYVDDVDAEVEEADKESTERLEKADVYGFGVKKKFEKPTEIPIGGGKITEKEMKELTKKIKEMMEKEKKGVKEMIEKQDSKIKKVEKFKEILEKALEEV